MDFQISCAIATLKLLITTALYIKILPAKTGSNTAKAAKISNIDINTKMTNCQSPKPPMSSIMSSKLTSSADFSAKNQNQ